MSRLLIETTVRVTPIGEDDLSEGYYFTIEPDQEDSGSINVIEFRGGAESGRVNMTFDEARHVFHQGNKLLDKVGADA